MFNLTLVFLLTLIGATTCGKKPAEIEMRLPVPSPTPTSSILATPTFLPTLSPTPSKPEPHYYIEDIKGTVLVNSGDSTVPESAAEGETLEPGDVLITQDGSEATLTLNKDTMVHLDANSQVRVTALSANGSNGFTSKLELLLGNLLSEVEKLGESRSSFEVEAGGVVCAVRGTAFEVQKQGDIVSTNTYHGQVAMRKNGKTQLVNANERSIYSLSTKGFHKKRKLTLNERKHYQTWTKTKARIQQKREDRIAGHPKTSTPALKPKVQPKSAKASRPSIRNPQKGKHPGGHRPARKQSKKPKPKPRPTPVPKKVTASHPSGTAPAKKTAPKPQPRKATPVKKSQKKKKGN